MARWNGFENLDDSLVGDALAPISLAMVVVVVVVGQRKTHCTVSARVASAGKRLTHLFATIHLPTTAPSTTSQPILQDHRPHILLPHARTRPSYVDVHEYRLADAVNLGDDALEVECLREHDLEYLLHVDRRGGRAEDEGCVHCFCESFCLEMADAGVSYV